MAAYWAIFTYLIFFALIEKENRELLPKNDIRFISLLIIITIFLSVFIGLRHEIGGDWISYILMFEELSVTEFTEIFNLSNDPGYSLINWLASSLGFSIHAVNLFCALIFSFGLSYFCLHTKRPFLAIMTSFPYLIVVVAMGYTRQSAAIGLAMIAYITAQRQEFFKFFLLIVAAATFHKTAIILLAIAAAVFSKNRFFILTIFSLIAFLLISSPLFQEFEELYEYYVIADYQSQGAAVRVAMLFFPSLIFLIWPHRFAFDPYQEKLWKVISLISLGLMACLILLDASTAVDRIALYFLPIQLMIFAHLPDIIQGNRSSKSVIILLIILFYILVMTIWFNFAYHSHAWLPYNNIIFELL